MPRPRLPTGDPLAAALRVSLGGVFIWFGALKATGASAVTDLVASVAAWVPLIEGASFVHLVGLGEVALGVWLLVGRPRRLVLAATVAHLLVASALAVAARPDLVFQANNPLLLTVAGQFVAKNVVMVFAIGALLTQSPPLAARQRRRSRSRFRSS